MRAAPPIQVSLRDPRPWRVAVLGTVAGGLAALAAWVASHRANDGPAEILPIALVVAVVSLGCARSLLRRPPRALRWDGEHWHLGDDFEAIAPGEVTVAIDVGRWLLLRFVATGTGPGAIRSCWLPIDRRGLEPRWHALRCALYAPAPRAATHTEDAADAARPGR